MTSLILTGGLRRRLILESFKQMMAEKLDDLGWFDSGRENKPVKLSQEQVDYDQEIQPNLIAITTEDLVPDEWELGSNMEENSWEIYCDVFAENESVGIHLTGDVFDIIRGKFSTLGRNGPAFDVYNLTTASKPYLFTVEIMNPDWTRVRDWERPFNKYWWSIGFQAVDYYTNEEG